MVRSVALVPLLTLALTSGAAPSPAEQATCGRIDIYVVDNAFALAEPKGVGFGRVSYCSWLGPGRERSGVSCEKTLGREWEEVWVEFTAEGDGQVDIDLQGEWYEPRSPTDVRLVWVDQVTVEGSAIHNGDFETPTGAGRPEGWRFLGAFPDDRYSRDGSVARSGSACVATWYGCQVRQAFTVRRGQTYRVRAWFRLLDPSVIREPLKVGFEVPFDTYRQELELEFRSAAAAGKATVRLTPLFAGRQWAVSSRWDDNNPDNLKMRDVLLRHGHRGTFYLNGPWRDWAELPATVDVPWGRGLLQGGCTIGGHSLTHPLLSLCSRNRIFEEVAGVRLVWEAAADTLVNSYSFSYCNFTNGFENEVVQADIARALERAGFYGVANEPQFETLQTDLVLSPIMPADGADIDGFAQSALTSDAYRDRHPNLTYSMHVWYRTPEAWAKFEAQLDKYGHRPDWWYCNQNEYAAYRYQYRWSSLATPELRGTRLRLRLERPLLLDLNDAVPLTFEVGGVAPEDLVAAACATADCRPSPDSGKPLLFHLHHDRDLALPSKIGMTQPNTEARTEFGPRDSDPDFPGLQALLGATAQGLRLRLHNAGTEPLGNVRVTYRLPLAFKPGIVRRRLAPLPAAAQTQDSLTLEPSTADYKFLSGNSFFVAQIDFARAGTAGRLYATCYRKHETIDRSYPQAGFLHLGPVPADQLDVGRLVSAVASGTVTTQPWCLNDDTRLEWQAHDGPFVPPFLDPELPRLSGAWWGGSSPAPLHLLQADLSSDREQPVEFWFMRGAVQRLLLDGVDLTDQPRTTLKAGRSRLFLVCADAVGCFLRLLEPGTDTRLTSVRFGPPAAAGPGADVYRPGAAGPPRRKSLAGSWRAKLVRPLAPAASMETALPDPGISAEARALLAPEVDDAGWEERQVPQPWRAYGGDWAASDGEAVFRKGLEVPAEWAGKDLLLSLGPIDDFDDTFVNGTLVGRTDAKTPAFYATPRRYTLPANVVRPGRNLIAVRIFDHFGEGGFTATTPVDLFLAPKE